MLPSLAIGSEVGGVRDSGFEANAGYRVADDVANLRAGGTFNYGLTDFLASGISAQIGHTFGEDSVVDSDTVTVGADLFARKFELGKVGLGYFRTHSRFDVPVDDDSVDHNTYSAFAEYYMGQLTFKVSRQALRSADVADFDAWSLGVAGYLSENTRLSVSGAGMDAADLYGVSVAHQPGWFQDKGSVSLAYSRSPDDDAVSLELNYFFGNKVSLRVRDRELR
ncbi:hypothetical protein [Hydrocarboniclastica marina]|uniref:hypothetical protein n=1 Tax=Hydrocarboniclastica marina TaxID=2259620 RepID=UPI0010A8E83C|nr:hypothetical protein [Hydrocarboniclastica marina]